MRGLILIGITLVGSLFYGVKKIFEKYAFLDIASFTVIFLLMFGVYRLFMYAITEDS